MKNIQHVCVLGGTGFVGHALVGRLIRSGRRVTVLTRRPERYRELLVNPGVRLLRADIHQQAVLERAFQSVDAVVNLVGILNESKRQTFRSVHVELPRKIMHACWKAKVPRLLHMSALNADAGRGTSQYLRTKGEAEDLLHVDAGDDLQVTRFRPSVIFGPGDSLFNRFAELLRMSPLVFPLACPQARFAPVYVQDVAQAMVQVLEDPASYDERYELCGPHVYTLQQLVEYTAELCNRQRIILPLPNALSRLQAAFLEMMPGKPFSLDNYDSLQVDSICREDGFARLGITPVPVEALVPGYLGRDSMFTDYDRLRRYTRRT